MKNKRETVIPVLLGILVSIVLLFVIKVFVLDKMTKTNDNMNINETNAASTNINESNISGTEEDNGKKSNQVSMIFGGDFLLSNEMLNAYIKMAEV